MGIILVEKSIYEMDLRIRDAVGNQRLRKRQRLIRMINGHNANKPLLEQVGSTHIK